MKRAVLKTAHWTVFLISTSILIRTLTAATRLNFRITDNIFPSDLKKRTPRDKNLPRLRKYITCSWVQYFRRSKKILRFIPNLIAGLKELTNGNSEVKYVLNMNHQKKKKFALVNIEFFIVFLYCHSFYEHASNNKKMFNKFACLESHAVGSWIPSVFFCLMFITGTFRVLQKC